MKIAYNIWMENDILARDRFHNEIWKIKVPQWLRAFLWIVMNGALIINFARVRRRIASTDTCVLFNRLLETTLYVLKSMKK